MLHGLQAGVLPEDHPGLEVRAEASGVHRHPLRAEVRLQASSRAGLLPGSLLRNQLLVQLKTDDIGWTPRVPQIEPFYEELSKARK